MPIIRTIFRPWEDVEVSEAEAASLAAMGLLSHTGSVEPGPSAAPEPDAEPSAPKTGRRTKTTTTAPAEEVKTDGSSKEGGQAQEG